MGFRGGGGGGRSRVSAVPRLCDSSQQQADRGADVSLTMGESKHFVLIKSLYVQAAPHTHTGALTQHEKVHTRALSDSCSLSVCVCVSSQPQPTA